MILFILPALFCFSAATTLPEPFDFVEDALQNINKTADPCDNFYRHACPIGSHYNILIKAFEEITDILRHNGSFRHDDFPISIEIEEVRSILRGTKFPVFAKTFIESFQEVCDFNVQQSHRFLLSILPKLGFLDEISFNNRKCEKTVKALNVVFNLKESEENLIKAESLVWYFGNYFEELRKQMNAISAHYTAGVKQGVLESEQMFKEMLYFASELVTQTPWAINNNVTDDILRYTNILELGTHFSRDRSEISGRMLTIRRFYHECLNNFEYSRNSRFFCFVKASTEVSIEKYPTTFSLFNEAFNSHPEVSIGFPNYYHTTYGREKASILGYTGFTIGHEIGHSFVENSKYPGSLGFFSKTAQDCIQQQYAKTCDVFREYTCDISDQMFENNGADIFGLHLSYELLARYYHENLKTVIPRLGLTPEQLYFYSYAFQFCGGFLQGSDGSSHASRNVRVNIIAQHPGFQKAFNCPAESRMMQSANPQCIIYGPDAPETRKKFINH